MGMKACRRFSRLPLQFVSLKIELRHFINHLVPSTLICCRSRKQNSRCRGFSLKDPYRLKEETPIHYRGIPDTAKISP